MPTIIDGTNGVNQVQSNAIEQGDLQLAASSIGVGQTWQNLTASRALSTTYTNSTGKPIYVCLHFNQASTNVNTTITVGGVVIINSGGQANVSGGSLYSFIVPNGNTYVCTSGNGLVTWTELR